MKDKSAKIMEKDQTSTSEAPRAAEPAKAETAKMDVLTWFGIKLKENRKLKPAHYAPIVAFFNTKKLGKNEPREVFEEALKEFGFK